MTDTEVNVHSSPSDHHKSKKRRRKEGNGEDEERRKKKKDKKQKKEKKKKKKQKVETKEIRRGDERCSAENEEVIDTNISNQGIKTSPIEEDEKIIVSSALDFAPSKKKHDESRISLLLFYQYVEPPWDSDTFHMALSHMQKLGERLNLTGRMRVAREGLNCTLTGSKEGLREYCAELRKFHKGEFSDTEFKLTDDLSQKEAFPKLHVFPVEELVHYGLVGGKAPPITSTGTHLEPEDYHEKMKENDTVIIDVRNHYEAAIGHFQPPGAQWVDPKMRKSTEFPVWLDKPETKKLLRGKQVLMYCTGGVRCERASALLKHKIENEEDTKELGIKGVYQLQGGVDKYFKNFPDGGFWKGKNYTFDKRCAHAPPVLDCKEKLEDEKGPKSGADSEDKVGDVLGRCEACQKPWDNPRGKRRCPTCGVPSLICRECYQADKEGTKKLKKFIRCDLCIEQNVTSKAELREKEQKELEEYEQKLTTPICALAANPDQVTRLHIKNMCRINMDESTLVETLPGITHIVWKTDRRTGAFLGSAWVEMATTEDAARAVAMNGAKILGRALKVEYEKPDGKDCWPPPRSAISIQR